MTDLQQPYYQVLDRGDKPYLLLLHGVMSSRSQWLANVEELKRYTNPVLVELLGHGRSPSPLDASCYSPLAYVDFFDQLRRQLGVEHWFICGQSFSAGLTMRYSLTHPSRVKGQIFTNSVSALARADTRERQAERMGTVATLRNSGRDALMNMRYFPRKGRLPDAVFDAMIADIDLLDPAGLAMSMEHTVPELSVREIFHRTEVPTLLINGAWEKVFQPVAVLAGELLPALRRVDLDGGHSINAENAAGFNQAVVDFVGAVR